MRVNINAMIRIAGQIHCIVPTYLEMPDGDKLEIVYDKMVLVLKGPNNDIYGPTIPSEPMKKNIVATHHKEIIEEVKRLLAEHDGEAPVIGEIPID